jgi:hypothetical protein
MLFGLYLIVKYLGTEWINWALQWYFTVAGVGCGGKVGSSFLVIISRISYKLGFDFSDEMVNGTSRMEAI